MHSAEPFDPRPVNPAGAPPAAETWRAEVASRLHSYRARRKNKGADSLALDFERAADATVTAETIDPASAQATEDATVASGQQEAAVDTNYYRRLNARAIEQGSATQSADAAMVRIAELAEDEAVAARRQQGSAGLEIDLALQAPAAGDACLERYSIHGAAGDWQPADTSAAQDPLAIFCDAGLDEAESGQAAARADTPAPVAGPAQSNVIVFPRPLLDPPLQPLPSRDELADPVHARPRILEVPEDIMPAVQGSLFPEIRLDADEPELGVCRQPEIEAPLQVAPLAVRLTAALADLVVVLAAGAVFAAITARALPEVPHAKPYWMGMGVATVLFWAVYQNWFLLYAGRTLGMSMNGIHLSTFDGREPGWEERRRRAIFTIVSFVSVALGFLWALVDEDALCWHDRVSRTFPTKD